MGPGGRSGGSRESLRPERYRAEVLNEVIGKLCRLYPTLRRGGMSFPQLRNLLLARAHRRGMELVVKVKPWPEAGMVSQVGNRLVVNIDSRRSLQDRTRALAHEAGHVLLGHFELEGEVWTLMEGPGADEWEWEADFFANFALRTPGTPADWFLRSQLELL